MKHNILLLAFLVAFSQHRANAQNDMTPLMGWSSWNTFLFHISDSIICSQANAMISTGLHKAGYTYINIDDGFFGGRDEDGHLLTHPERFPRGLKPVVEHIHSLGLKAGIYSDAGRSTCSGYFDKEPTGQIVGLYGHDREDCRLFFDELDFDFIKIDYCGGFAKNNAEGLQLCERDRYADIVRSINSCRKKGIRVNACRWDYPGTWISDLVGSWRTTHDISCSWRSVANIIAQNLYLSAYSSPGHFNDMDMLEVGRGLSPEEDKTHFALWCIMASPLLVGCDMTRISPEALALMTNPHLIALNQDRLGIQAYPAQCVSGCHVLVKDIGKRYGNKRAVAIYNPREEVKDVRLLLKDLNLAGKVKVIDCFTGEDASHIVTNGVLVLPSIPSHGTAVFTIEAEQRLEQAYYEAEAAYNPSYQELTNNQASRTGWYEYDGRCRSDMKASWLGGNEENCLIFRNVHLRKAGNCTLTIAYLTDEQRTMNIEVNGKKVGKYTCEAAEDVVTVTLQIKLNKGDNIIRLYNNHKRLPDIDYIKITKNRPS